MTVRTIAALLPCLALSVLPRLAAAIEGDQLIDPSGESLAAQEQAAEDASMGELFSGQGGSPGSLLSFLGYAVIIGCLALVVWYFSKRGSFRRPFSKASGKLNIAETRMLGNRQFISVVEYENQKILIGVGPGKIDYLTTLQDYGAEFTAVDSESSEGVARDGGLRG